MKTVVTRNREETIKLGEKVAKTLRPGDVIALIGPLGSGKTTLVKGIAKGLGLKSYRYVNSPSFVIIKEYPSKIPLYHFDGSGVSVIEWADKIKKLLPKQRANIKIEMLKGDKRKITIL